MESAAAGPRGGGARAELAELRSAEWETEVRLLACGSRGSTLPGLFFAEFGLEDAQADG